LDKIHLAQKRNALQGNYFIGQLGELVEQCPVVCTIETKPEIEDEKWIAVSVLGSRLWREVVGTG
jgi:hypothetical protein